MLRVRRARLRVSPSGRQVARARGLRGVDERARLGRRPRRVGWWPGTQGALTFRRPLAMTDGVGRARPPGLRPEHAPVRARARRTEPATLRADTGAAAAGTATRPSPALSWVASGVSGMSAGGASVSRLACYLGSISAVVDVIGGVAGVVLGPELCDERRGAPSAGGGGGVVVWRSATRTIGVVVSEATLILGRVVSVTCVPPAVMDVIGAYGLIDDISLEWLANVGHVCGAAGGVAGRALSMRLSGSTSGRSCTTVMASLPGAARS